MVSPRTISANQKPDHGMKTRTRLYKRSVHGSKFTVPGRREAYIYIYIYHLFIARLHITVVQYEKGDR